jgi:hypothetical protein
VTEREKCKKHRRFDKLVHLEKIFLKIEIKKCVGLFFGT